MKRTLFFAMGALAAFSFKAAAQDIDYYTLETTEGVVYLLPKTMLEVNVIATKLLILRASYASMLTDI